MKNYHIFSTRDNGKIPAEKLTPEDFSDDKYEGRYIMKAHDGSMVIILSSISANPVHWCVTHSNSTSYFLSHQQTMDYCRDCGYKFVKGGSLK